MGRVPTELRRMALDVASLEPIWPVAVTQLCRWSVSGAVVVLGPTGVPLEMDRLAAASPSDLADAVVVMYDQKVAARFMHVPS